MALNLTIKILLMIQAIQPIQPSKQVESTDPPLLSMDESEIVKYFTDAIQNWRSQPNQKANPKPVEDYARWLYYTGKYADCIRLAELEKDGGKVAVHYAYLSKCKVAKAKPEYRVIDDLVGASSSLANAQKMVVAFECSDWDYFETVVHLVSDNQNYNLPPQDNAQFLHLQFQHYHKTCKYGPLGVLASQIRQIDCSLLDPKMAAKLQFCIAIDEYLNFHFIKSKQVADYAQRLGGLSQELAELRMLIAMATRNEVERNYYASKLSNVDESRSAAILIHQCILSNTKLPDDTRDKLVKRLIKKTWTAVDEGNTRTVTIDTSNQRLRHALYYYCLKSNEMQLLDEFYKTCPVSMSLHGTDRFTKLLVAYQSALIIDKSADSANRIAKEIYEDDPTSISAAFYALLLHRKGDVQWRAKLDAISDKKSVEALLNRHFTLEPIGGLPPIDLFPFVY